MGINVSKATFMKVKKALESVKRTGASVIKFAKERPQETALLVGTGVSALAGVQKLASLAGLTGRQRLDREHLKVQKSRLKAQERRIDIEERKLSKSERSRKIREGIRKSPKVRRRKR